MKKLLILPIIALAIGVYLFRPTDKPIKPVLVTESVQVPEPEQKQPEIKLYTPDELLAITNEIRIENNVKPLELDVNLNKSAQMKLDEMTREQNFEHLSETGKNGPSYINDLNIQCYYTSENLQRVTPYVKQIKDFKGSESHWNAVINSDYETVGFAMNNQYFVMHFCDKDAN